jgi:NAD(P)-dependent dehydrogenase (short-subunit alcohol dehydrogenase family)
MRLEGKVAIVTGGGRGIGRGIVLCLAEEGADVVVNSLHKDTTERVAAEVRALGRKSLAIAADVTDEEKVTEIVHVTINTFGKIDILVNNVGGMGRVHFKRTSEAFVNQAVAEWDEAYEINLKSAVLMSRAVIPYFIEQKSGKILNVSSGAGKRASPRIMAYGATKAGVLSFTKSLAEEMGQYNINVNCICPGRIDTPLYEEDEAQFVRFNPDAGGMTPRERLLKYIESQPLKREVTVEDVGRAVVFLVSEDARSITGQSLSVNGGSRMD